MFFKTSLFHFFTFSLWGEKPANGYNPSPNLAEAAGSSRNWPQSPSGSSRRIGDSSRPGRAILRRRATGRKSDDGGSNRCAASPAQYGVMKRKAV